MKERLKYGILIVCIFLLGAWVWAVGKEKTWQILSTAYSEAQSTVEYLQTPHVTTHAPGASPRVFVGFTFDDNEKSVLLATPVLEKNGLRSTQFIITCSPEASPGFHMSWYNIRKLYGRGHEMGSHTCSHDNLMTDTDRERVWREINASRERLAREIGAPITVIKSFAAPTGEYGPAEIELIQKAGYSYAVTSWGDGPNVDKLKPYVLVRFDVTTERPSKEVCSFIDKAIEAGRDNGQPALIIFSFHFFTVESSDSPPSKLRINVAALAQIVQCIVQRRDSGEVFAGTLTQATEAYERAYAQTKDTATETKGE